jgi:hypothetical protein
VVLLSNPSKLCAPVSEGKCSRCPIVEVIRDVVVIPSLLTRSFTLNSL